MILISPIVSQRILIKLGTKKSVGVREQPRKVGFWKFQMIAMVITKNYSKSLNINLIFIDFGMWSLLHHITLSAKNEQNLPHGSGDKPIATAWQLKSDWGSGGITWPLRHPISCNISCNSGKRIWVRWEPTRQWPSYMNKTYKTDHSRMNSSLP